jgi:hypothetical protein
LEVSEIRGVRWRFTGVYEESQSELKFKIWDLMEWLFAQYPSHMAWLSAGNFNEILFQHEKEGGKARPQACLDWFRGALEKCELDELGFTGDIFTWRNKQTKGASHIRERLDRAMANGGWRMMFPLMSVKNADPYHSDHRPVVVVTEALKHGSGGVSNFKFEATWLQEEGCRKVIEDAWGLGGSGESCLRENLSEVAASLKEWSVNALGDLEKWLKLAKKGVREVEERTY